MAVFRGLLEPGARTEQKKHKIYVQAYAIQRIKNISVSIEYVESRFRDKLKVICTNH